MILMVLGNVDVYTGKLSPVLIDLDNFTVIDSGSIEIFGNLTSSSSSLLYFDLSKESYITFFNGIIDGGVAARFLPNIRVNSTVLRYTVSLIDHISQSAL